MQTLEVNGKRLEYEWLGPAPDQAPTLVFLHEGLGCAAGWLDFPERLVEATGCGGLVYSRLGYGGSDPLERPFDVRFMHHEALIVLPSILEATGIERPILVGHSDGASIGLIYAGSGRPARALVVEAPHVFVEEATLAGIRSVSHRFEAGSLKPRLERNHGANTEPTFRAWTGIWLDPAFRAWSIAELLPAIACPVLAFQGEHDEFGTPEQLRRIEEGVAGRVEARLLSGCAHFPHRENPEQTLTLMRTFISSVLEADAGA